MNKPAQEEATYVVRIEGVPMVLDAMGLASEVVAQWLEAESQEALIRATPEQVGKLRELLHVRSVEPAGNGVYIDRFGKWHAVKDRSIIQSGNWLVPLEVLRSISGATEEAAPPTILAAAASRETDPVCGAQMRPGQEAANVNFQGNTYHFCSDECRKLFLSNPTTYVKQKAGAA